MASQELSPPVGRARGGEDDPQKPAYGASCNGCGLCCTATACSLAMAFVDGAVEGQRCPALEWTDNRFWCGLYRHPERYVRHTLWRELSGKRSRFRGSIAKDLFRGGCDSGAPDGIGVDDFLGWTAAEYAAHAFETGLTWGVRGAGPRGAPPLRAIPADPLNIPRDEP